MSGVTGEQDWYVSGVFSMSFVNLNDTFGDYVDRAGLVPKVNAAEDTLIPSDTKIDAHALRHIDGGADELDVAELSGALGLDGQVPKTDGLGVTWVNLAHGNLSGVGYNNHHGVGTGIKWDVDSNIAHESPSVHESGGALEITHNNLVLTSSDHHSRYSDSEAITAINDDADHGSTAPHNYFSGNHSDLTNVLASQHHVKYTDSEAISAVEGNANVFSQRLNIKITEDNYFLYLTDWDTYNQIRHYVDASGTFQVFGYRSNDSSWFKFYEFVPASGVFAFTANVQIPRTALKTSTGSVSTAQTLGENMTLPGGEYGFYPQIKNSGANYTSWGYDESTGNGKWTARMNGETYITTACLAPEGGTAYMRQRYLTSSGEVHWVFILRDKKTNEILSVWQAPDHPCFGNGGNPDTIDQPHMDYDPLKHDLIVINPSSTQVRAINRFCLNEDGMENSKDFIEAMFELFEIKVDNRIKWPDIPVTVGLTSDFSDNPRQVILKRIDPHPQAIMGRLHAL